MPVKERGIGQMQKIKEPRKAKIGIYTMGLQCYWAQFEGLRDRLLAYGRFIAEKVEALGAEVYFYGIVDCETEGRKAGEYFAANNVDLIFAHSGTYVTSASAKTRWSAQCLPRVKTALPRSAPVSILGMAPKSALMPW